jgi:hypothetical protein
MKAFNKRPILPLIAVAALATTLVVGCGGSDDAPVAVAPPAPAPILVVPGTEVPVSAVITGAGAFVFVSGVVNAGSKDSAEPIEVEPATLGFSDNEEPDGSV